MKIRIHWDHETGRVSANCQNHSVTLIRQSRSHLEDLVESDEDILTVKYTGKGVNHLVPAEENTISQILVGDLIEVDPIDWTNFCTEFEQIDESGKQFNKNEFMRFNKDGLLPCPFCGGVHIELAEESSEESYVYSWLTILCEGCGAKFDSDNLPMNLSELNLMTEKEEFIQSLKNHWNRRYA
jgi:Restriction alleviation protein Lar